MYANAYMHYRRGWREREVFEVALLMIRLRYQISALTARQRVTGVSLIKVSGLMLEKARLAHEAQNGGEGKLIRTLLLWYRLAVVLRRSTGRPGGNTYLLVNLFSRFACQESASGGEGSGEPY